LHYKVINGNIRHGFKQGFLLWSIRYVHLAKHLAPTQRPLGSTYIVAKVFGVEDSMMTIEKKRRGDGRIVVKVNCK
jgi:hypothetical protein